MLVSWQVKAMCHLKEDSQIKANKTRTIQRIILQRRHPHIRISRARIKSPDRTHRANHKVQNKLQKAVLKDSVQGMEEIILVEESRSPLAIRQIRKIVYQGQILSMEIRRSPPFFRSIILANNHLLWKCRSQRQVKTWLMALNNKAINQTPHRTWTRQPQALVILFHQILRWTRHPNTQAVNQVWKISM